MGEAMHQHEHETTDVQGHEQDHDHGGGAHDHDHDHEHRPGILGWLQHTFAHSHDVYEKVDDAMETHERGIWALKVSLVVLGLTALFQVVIVWMSGSTALLADTIHNFGDAATSIPLWIAFALIRRGQTRRFTYGFGRAEDIAGVVIVLIILFSAVVAGYQAVERLINPQPVGFLWAVAAASLVGFMGNEAVAVFRIRVGREIGSAALVAEGYHARTDGWTSLAVLLGAVGVWLGYPLADPIVGLLIAAAILVIVWQSGKAVFTRLLDGVEPEAIEEIRHTASRVPGVEDVSEVRARWLGHRLHAEVNVAVDPDLSVAEGHAIARELNHRLLHHLSYLSGAVIHVDPVQEAGEEHHRVAAHSHDGLPTHSH